MQTVRSINQARPTKGGEGSKGFLHEATRSLNIVRAPKWVSSCNLSILELSQMQLAAWGDVSALSPRIAPIWPRSTGYPDLGGCLLASPSGNQIWRMTVTPFTAATHGDSIGCNRSQPGKFWLCVAANERIVASTPHSLCLCRCN